MITILLPAHRLPTDDRARDNVLRDYFCERIPESRAGDNGWIIDVDTAQTADFYIDPRLDEGLRWWDPSLAVADIPLTRDRRHDWVLSLNDAWTVFAWSEWFATLGLVPDRLILLHVDDHNDLMSPRLGITDGGTGMIDLMSGCPVDLRDPATVESAVLSGAIAQGSFIAPLLHAANSVEVRHLCQHRYLEEQGRWSLRAVGRPDTLLDPNAVRPAIERDSSGGRPATCRLSADVDEWLGDLPDGDILLHVDFDYFNNRFDGDSDWASLPSRHDPSIDDVVARIGETVDAVARLDRPIAVISAALSPGFFPAEMWQPAVEAFEAALGMLQTV